MVIDFFRNLFKQNTKNENIEVKNLTNSNVFILQTTSDKDIVDISSILKNNPYNNIVINNPHSYSGSLATLSKNISRRAVTIEKIKAEWGEKTWLNIYGGYDTGKSQLSLLLSENLNNNNCLSYNFKDLSDNEFKNIIVLVFKEILTKYFENENSKLIIFDDLPQLGFDDNINKLFIELLNYCLVSNIKILSTSNFKINNKIINPIKDNFIELSIPLLNKQEIEDIISTYTEESKSLKYSTIIKSISEGYPVFVQIICQYLENSEWTIPLDEFTDFFSGKAFTELNEETYQKLLHTTQNESAREILYRLNIVLGTISNDTIEIISNVNPAINSPYEKINSLSGTWLQKNADETYFISPLIKNLGTNNVLQETKKEINNRLAQHVLSKKNLSQYDSQRAMNYFLAGESYDDAGMIMIMALQTYFKYPEIFTDTIFGSFWVSTSLPEQMKSLTKLAIRLLQLHIFNDLQLKKHPKFSLENKVLIREDLENIIKSNSDLQIEIINTSTLILFKSYILDDVKKALLYLESLNEIDFKDFEESEENLYNNLWVIFDKIIYDDEIEAWFDCFNKIGKEESFFDHSRMHLFSRRLFDNILEKENSWEEKMQSIEFVEAKAIENNLQILGAYSVKTNIFIIAEKLNKLSDAELYYEKVKSKYVSQEAIFLIKDELGRQQFYNGKKDEALLILLDIEAINISVITKLDTYLTIAKIFGDKDKVVAHEYTKKALEFAQNEIKVSRLSIAKLWGEYAISFWLLGDSKKAIYNLAECYELLLIAYKEIDDFADINDYNIVVVQIGNALNYIFQILSFNRPPEKSQSGDSYVVPYRGILNNNYNPVLLKEWYYDERKYLNVFLLIQCFEFYNDKDNAVKWANKAFEMDKEIFLYNFKNSLRSFVVYKILQNKYQESAEIEKEITDYEDTVNIGMADELHNSQQKQMFLNMLERLPSNKDKDYYYLTYNLIPILLKELTLIIENKNTEEQCVKNIKEHLFRNDFLYQDKDVITNIYYILDNFPRDYISSRKIIDWVNGIENENKKPLQIICYLICSLKAPSREALKIHLALMPYLEKAIKGFSEGTLLFILYPFVSRFWTTRIFTNPQDFYFLDLWHKNLNKSIEVKNKYKVISFYSLICMHMAYRPDINEQDWMQEYIDYVIKNK
ncbi:hypothetical protein [Flavobacterium salmonis]|uniref:Uncharacterized protein n=1 Tax=Flavobacterium salmonis TaxID=2654844 RepID=A0A6V6YVD2_9FLAO|nr:hypothetical protein [Flavobacterium salmonis]CAD0003356.1 hypothetical protein FLAT13_01639 [Flavobacterium salmonis]